MTVKYYLAQESKTENVGRLLGHNCKDGLKCVSSTEKTKKTKTVLHCVAVFKPVFHELMTYYVVMMHDRHPCLFIYLFL